MWASAGLPTFAVVQFLSEAERLALIEASYFPSDLNIFPFLCKVSK